MQKTQVLKIKFSQTSDKRFYLPNGITSLPIGHPYLNELTKYKEEKGKRIENYFLYEKNILLHMEKKVFSLNKRLCFYQQLLSQNFRYYLLN